MNIKEIGDVFHCDCGFSWSRGKNGNHNCANRLREKVRQLAAENVGLKKFIQTDCFVGHIEPETFHEEEVTRYVSADGYEPETPATDAYLARINTAAPALPGFLDYLRKQSENPKCTEDFKLWVQGVVNAAATYEAGLREGADK
ncbi:type III secretion system chaperone family protein [Klebsiella quasipneumoniae]|uniref:hypothetical protein n=1 Tax=Klebsiella quasipneumoniae TaxID=1463165 RepID=UPI00388DA853